MRKITKEFGLFFSEIEQMLRDRELTMHLLAVPIDTALAKDPEMRGANPNDHSRSCGFIAICYPEGRESLYAESLDKWNMSYDPLLNMVNLRDAGVYIPKPGTDAARQMMAKYN
jgi:hypothetical protein